MTEIIAKHNKVVKKYAGIMRSQDMAKLLEGEILKHDFQMRKKAFE